MIQLIPFYMSLVSPIHNIRDRDVANHEQNMKMSVSILNCALPALLEYLKEFEGKSIVVVCPSAKEGRYVSSCLHKWFRENKQGALNTLHWHDPLYRHRRIADETGIHVMCYHNMIKNLISCDIAISYYPFPKQETTEVYRRARKLALFDPINKTSNYYAAYIRMITDKKTGVKK